MKATRTEYPNPQFERSTWECLNGKWDFGFEKAKSGFRFSTDESKALEYYRKVSFPEKINVPFCLESILSGIGYKGFVNHAWYRKTVRIKPNNGRVFLHIGAADYLTTVLVNGKCAGRHSGGYTSFAFEITDFVSEGENEIFIFCEDNNKNPLVMRGKQCEKKESCGCEYTRTTGIWQSVWLEYTPKDYIKSIKLYPDIHDCSLTILASFRGNAKFSCKASYNGKKVGAVRAMPASGERLFKLELSEKHLWELGNGRLYDLELKFGDDKVKSYFGLRNVRMDGMKFLFNEKETFQSTVLDQGFYPDGIYTAPSEEALIKDIELSMAIGFNGARLHEKVFEPRFLYHCDRLGYMVWGEYPNWGLDYSNPMSIPVFLSEWKEALERDFNHPAIIGWCPFNETWDYHHRPQIPELLSTVYDFTKTFDSTRPCIDTSGSYHVKTDVYCVHDYDHNPESFKEHYDLLDSKGELYDQVNNFGKHRQTYRGEPVFISEYGGIKWVGDGSIASWGYGDDVKTVEEFLERYLGLTNAITANPSLFGLCYTQLYDIEQEQNGLYTYDRKKKFDDDVYEKIKAANTVKR